MELNDVTLREGSQLPGRSYTVAEKIEAAHALDELGLPYIQVGFPATGEDDREATRRLAAEADANIVGIARALPGDVDAALDAEVDVVEVFAPLSHRQLDVVVDKTRAEMLDAMRDAVDRALDGGVSVHLSLLDAFRTDSDHVVTAFERFSEVEYVNLADTVGARTPASVRPILDDLGERVDLSRAGAHFHDDLGVATANAMVAYEAGVGKADVSVGGLGERAGNVPLEEFVAVGDLDNDADFGVDVSELVPVCEEVLAVLGEEVPEQKALLGDEVTRHESGIHTAAMLDDPGVFEPFDPARFGGTRELVFGEGTGRGGARRLLERAGVPADEDAVATFLDLLAERGPVTRDAAVRMAEQELAD